MLGNISHGVNNTSLMTLVAVENLSRHFGARRAVSDLNLSVSRGEVLGFLGPNGAGKIDNHADNLRCACA